MTVLSGFDHTSATGARSALNPSTRISEAMVWAFCLAVSAPLVPIPEHRPDICRTHRTHQPVDAPAFLVAGQYERYFGIALGVGQHFTYLLPAFQVVTR